MVTFHVEQNVTQDAGAFKRGNYLVRIDGLRFQQSDELAHAVRKVTKDPQYVRDKDTFSVSLEKGDELKAFFAEANKHLQLPNATTLRMEINELIEQVNQQGKALS